MITLATSYLIAASLLFGQLSGEAQITIVDKVPVLMYHEIGEPEGPWGNLYVSEDNFADQIQFLKEHQFHTITMSQLERNRAGLQNLPSKPVVLTFDDGYASMYEYVYPLLKKYNMTATFYVYPNKFGKHNSLTPEQIKEMADNGMEFGSHSMTHPDMTKINLQQLIYEIKESKEVIESITGRRVTSFCYPAGRYNKKVIDQLHNFGYQSAVTTKNGKASLAQNDFELSRIRIAYEDSIHSFSNKIQ